MNKEFKISESLSEDPLMSVFSDRMAEIVKFLFHAVGICRLENISAGMEPESIISMFSLLRLVDQIDLGVDVREVSSQQQTVHFGHFRFQKSNVDLFLSCCGKRSEAALMAQDLRVRKERGNILFCLFQYLFIRIYKENPHYIKPPA